MCKRKEIEDKLLPVVCKQGYLKWVKILIERREGTDSKFISSLLYIASRHGHLEVVKFIVTHGVDINSYENFETSFGVATRYGHLEIVEFLLEQNGIDVNMPKLGYGSPLLVACQFGHLKVVQLLLARGNTSICAFLRDLPNIYDWKVVPNSTPELRAQRKKNYVPVSKLQYMFQRWCHTNGHSHRWQLIEWQEACDAYKIEVKNLCLPWFPVPGEEAELIKRDYCFGILAPGQIGQPGANGTHRVALVDLEANGRGDTALIIASRHGQVEVVELLLERGFRREAANKYGMTALLLACQHGHNDVVQALLGHGGVDVNQTNNRGDTALLLASQHGHFGVVQALLGHGGVDVNQTNNRGDTALLIACQRLACQRTIKNRLDDVVQALLGHGGIDVNRANKVGETPLSLACENDRYFVVSILLKQVGIRVNHFAPSSSRWRTPLGICIEHGHYSLIVLLLQKYDVDVNLVAPKDGTTALHLACELGDCFVVGQLLTHDGVVVNSKNSSGTTALYLACKLGHSLVVQRLLTHDGVDVNSPDLAGRTPLYVACQNGHLEVVQLLLYFGLVNSPDLQGRTLLLSFFKRHMIPKHVDVNSPDIKGQTPFYVACQNGHLDVVQTLLGHGGVDVNSRTNGSFVVGISHSIQSTPLSIACYHGHLKVVKVLLAHGVDVNQSVSSDHKTALDVITHERRCANNNEIALTIVYLVFHGAKGVRGDIYELWKKSSVVVDGLLSFYDDARAINAFRLCLDRASAQKKEGKEGVPDHVLCAMSMNGMELVNHIESFLVPSSINARRTIVYFVRWKDI